MVEFFFMLLIIDEFTSCLRSQPFINFNKYLLNAHESPFDLCL